MNEATTPQDERDDSREFWMTPFASQRLIYDIRDEDGRPHGELAASDEARAGVDFTTTKCRFAGTRNGALINLPALQQMTANWDRAMQLCSWLRAEYLRRGKRDVATEGPLSLFDTWWIGVAGTSISAYLMRRAKTPLSDRQIPAYVSASFKMLMGLEGMPRAMFLGGLSDTELPAATAYHVFAEETGTFQGGDGRVCAASPKMIDEFLTTIAHPRPLPGSESLMTALLGDVDGFFRYADALVMFLLTAAASAIENYQTTEALATALEPVGTPLAIRMKATSNRLVGVRANAGPFPEVRMPDVRARCMEVVRREWSTRFETSDAPRLIGGARSTPAELEHVERSLARFIDDADVRHAVAAAVADQAAVERDIARLFTLLQARCNAALGRPGPKRPIEVHDLVETFKGGVWDVVRMSLDHARAAELRRFALASDVVASS